VSQAYHCYALNYINALNYLETLRRHVEFCEFEKVRDSTRTGYYEGHENVEKCPG
jgi:hypothetical protein